MKSNMFSHHHTHTGVKQTSTGIQSGMGSREFPQRMIRYPSKVTFYVFPCLAVEWIQSQKFDFTDLDSASADKSDVASSVSVAKNVQVWARQWKQELWKQIKKWKTKKKQTALTDWHPRFLPAWLLAFTVLAVSGCAVYCALGLCTTVICLVNRDTTAG